MERSVPRPSSPRAYDHGRLRQLESGGHFWIRARESLLDRTWQRHSLHTANSVLDVGSGTGRWAEHLARSHPRVSAMDFTCDSRRPAVPGGVSWVRGTADRLPFRDASLDVVSLLDVLEHLEDDGAALSEVWRVLAPGGHVVLTVPAVPGLWSLRDEQAGHRRRYLRGPLGTLLLKGGFQVLECRYAFFLLLPLTWVSRFRSRHSARFPEAEQDPPSWLNALLWQICRLELALGRWCDWPLGSSLLLLGRKP